MFEPLAQHHNKKAFDCGNVSKLFSLVKFIKSDIEKNCVDLTVNNKPILNGQAIRTNLDLLSTPILFISC